MTVQLRPWIIVWDHFGPYHYARVTALMKKMAVPIIPVQVARHTMTYNWEGSTLQEGCAEVIALQDDLPAEKLGFLKVLRCASRLFRELKPAVVFCPSYWPPRSLAIVFVARLAGARTVMMNESHAGTERSGAIGRHVKSALLKLFNAALLGGAPHRRYFASLGMAKERIFTGYDAVDNDYFQQAANEARADATKVRRELRLPERYILNLGRMVSKKNLSLLIKAYFTMRKRGCGVGAKLVLVGSGEEETGLKRLCDVLQLAWQDLSDSGEGLPSADVLFYGFRQIDQNPVFYALADCFVLPSLYEEWGLVVNEAMACGLPVLVSQTAGCAEDLVLEGQNGYTFSPESEEDLAQRLGEICDNGKLRRRMGTESLNIIEKWGCENFAENAIRAAEKALST
ncbi:glycosyltransferase involved in cell wall biosynthesis [Prosthecobacter fusiformis]|uniref:Glycosyltransferase involved in cell wall biosynthesis n=1 Tax=Prosthecobacter fusiformis TaxID=48464 RepID=A0A4R7RZP1_9BACT|nr:glycosyltransferase [Prosthecobacter fusiformis]TDU71422.1 glycosyltransferase involved in cell wall biosynthesis [Prosthecobacter fusiformis]